MRKINLLITLISVLAISSQVVFADGMEPPTEPAFKDSSAIQNNDGGSATLHSASSDDLAAAIGHYARARSLLIAAVNEFDSGYKLAKPDALIDSKQWRNTLISRAEEMERVLAPQPRVTRGGIKYQADSRLLKKN